MDVYFAVRTEYVYNSRFCTVKLPEVRAGTEVNTHISIFILVISQLDAQNLFYNKFISCLYMFRAPCSHRQEVKIVLYSLWYHHTETSEWSKITKITKITKIYKYEHIAKFMSEFTHKFYCYVLIFI